MTSTRLHQKSVESGLRPPCFNRRTGGSGHAQCSIQEVSFAQPRYDAKPARFASNQRDLHQTRAAENFAVEVLPALV